MNRELTLAVYIIYYLAIFCGGLIRGPPTNRDPTNILKALCSSCVNTHIAVLHKSLDNWMVVYRCPSGFEYHIETDVGAISRKETMSTCTIYKLMLVQYLAKKQCRMNF